KVDQAIYNSSAIGPVPVTYIRSRPTEFYIEGRNHNGADSEILAAMSFYGAIVSVLLGIGLVALLVARGGGRPHGRPTPVASGAMARLQPRRRPGQFGAR